jgi:HEAT repeat protein
VKKGGPLERYAAAWALGRIGPNARTAVPALIELLKDGKEYDLNLHYGSNPAFGVPRSPREIPPSIMAYIPAEALGNIGPDARAALPGLREMALLRGSRSGNTAFAASEAIKKIDPGSADPGKADGRPEPQPRRRRK